MKVLIITGELAYPLIKEVVSKSKDDIIVHIADNTQVAAFLTPRQIIKEVKVNFSNQLDEIDMILVPGLIKKGTREITKELGIPTFKGSTDGADLAMVLNLLEKITLSEDKPADKLIEEEKRQEAFKFIEEFENDKKNIEKLLKKPNNIMIRNLPVGEDFPMRVKCEPIFMDDLSECKMGNEHILRDNEFYNIHYSTNIYNKSLDINETAIGEFRFEDTKINDMRYYVIKNNIG